MYMQIASAPLADVLATFTNERPTLAAPEALTLAAPERSYAPSPSDPAPRSTTRSYVDPSDPVERQLAVWAGRYGLTPTESDVLMLTAYGMSNSEIASHRGSTTATVKTQAASICRKLRTRSIAQGALRLLRDVVEESAAGA